MNDTKLVVQADNLTAGYLPGINILNGCTLEAYKGELIGIIGPNGAGKSTLLKALFGLGNIRDGAVRLDGEDVPHLHTNQPRHKGVGFVPQTNNVFPSLSIEENPVSYTHLDVYKRQQQFEAMPPSRATPMTARRCAQSFAPSTRYRVSRSVTRFSPWTGSSAVSAA